MWRCFLFLIFLLGVNQTMALPKGFVYLEEIDSSIIQEIKYASADNFVGRPISGYVKPRCILTEKAARALSAVQFMLKPMGYSLKVFDAYRPSSAIEEFMQWSQDPADQKMKKNYYPTVDKKDFFKLGYLLEKSAHNRGSTVDLTLVKTDFLGRIKEINMGTHFDFMDPLSHTFSSNISKSVMKNRLLLQEKMILAGFEPINEEWWHFTLKNEPFPQGEFEFLVE